MAEPNKNNSQSLFGRGNPFHRYGDFLFLDKDDPFITEIGTDVGLKPLGSMKDRIAVLDTEKLNIDFPTKWMIALVYADADVFLGHGLVEDNHIHEVLWEHASSQVASLRPFLYCPVGMSRYEKTNGFCFVYEGPCTFNDAIMNNMFQYVTASQWESNDPPLIVKEVIESYSEIEQNEYVVNYPHPDWLSAMPTCVGTRTEPIPSKYWFSVVSAVHFINWAISIPSDRPIYTCSPKGTIVETAGPPSVCSSLSFSRDEEGGASSSYVKPNGTTTTNRTCTIKQTEEEEEGTEVPRDAGGNTPTTNGRKSASVHLANQSHSPSTGSEKESNGGGEPNQLAMVRIEAKKKYAAAAAASAAARYVREGEAAAAQAAAAPSFSDAHCSDVKVAAVSTSPSSNESSESEDDGSWICSGCLTVNSKPHGLTCVHCLTTRYKEHVDDAWKCSTCTFLNEKKRHGNVCDSCYEPRCSKAEINEQQLEAADDSSANDSSFVVEVVADGLAKATKRPPVEKKDRTRTRPASQPTKNRVAAKAAVRMKRPPSKKNDRDRTTSTKKSKGNPTKKRIVGKANASAGADTEVDDDVDCLALLRAADENKLAFLKKMCSQQPDERYNPKNAIKDENIELCTAFRSFADAAAAFVIKYVDMNSDNLNKEPRILYLLDRGDKIYSQALVTLLDAKTAIRYKKNDKYHLRYFGHGLFLRLLKEYFNTGTISTSMFDTRNMEGPNLH
mmetsp:Transcript_30956/g.62844  ORF Transcript_30956/g.62844 Transcript_30956/m.62844 type:complete len:728 (-) Transcript_30956:4291-6474(-)